jgi:hypothetical protein
MIPAPTDVRNLGRLLPIYAEFLEYAMEKALTENQPGALSYDGVSDCVIYHYTLDPLLDWELFQAQYGVEEVWIEQRVGGPS